MATLSCATSRSKTNCMGKGRETTRLLVRSIVSDSSCWQRSTFGNSGEPLMLRLLSLMTTRKNEFSSTHEEQDEVTNKARCSIAFTLCLQVPPSAASIVSM